MSTFTPFLAAPVEVLPKLACIGYVESIKDGAHTKKGVYEIVGFKLAPTESGKVAFGNFLYRPEWLVGGFDPSTLAEFENAKSLTTVYRMNICGTKELSVLAGIAGSQDAFYQLAGQLQSIEGEVTPEAVTAVLRDFVRENSPEIGYILKQKSVKNEETGKYDLEDGYELGGFFYPTEDEKKRLAKAAAAGKMVLTFEV